jgi:hypothetical protein
MLFYFLNYLQGVFEGENLVPSEVIPIFVGVSPGVVLYKTMPGIFTSNSRKAAKAFSMPP